MNNKNILAVAVLISMVQLFGIAHAQADALSLANLYVTPQPVLAGSNITIGFQLYNSYTAQLTNVNLELTGTYPILNFSPARTDIISSISQGTYGGTTFFTYNLHIPKTVNSGTYTLDAVATYQTTGTTGEQVSAESEMPISFYVRGTPNLRFTANPATGISPGSQSTVVLSVLNVGTDNATNVSVTILNSRNFSVLGGANFSLGTIAPQKTATASAILLTNSTLSSGTAELPLIVRYNTQYGTNETYSQNVPVTVSLGNPNIAVGIVSAQPASLYPGTNQTITLSLQNTGSGTAKNVTLSVISNAYLSAGNSAAKIYAGTIAAGASTNINVFVTANKGDSGSSYSLPVKLSYQNANYNSTINKTEEVPITLQPLAQFNVTEVVTKLAAGQTYVPIVLRVKNTGNEVAQSITFTLQSIYPISQVDPNAYINSLGPGQTANVTFYVNVDGQANAGQYPITLYEQWTQPTGTSTQQYSASQNYYANVGKGGLISLSDVIIVVVIVVGGVVLYRRMKKQQTQKKK